MKRQLLEAELTTDHPMPRSQRLQSLEEKLREAELRPDNYVESVPGIEPHLIARISRDELNRPLASSERKQLDNEIARMARELRAKREVASQNSGMTIEPEEPTRPE